MSYWSLFFQPEKYWLVWAGPLANHLFNFNSIFLSNSLAAAVERAACFADLDRSHSAATDGHRAAKLVWGIAWPFGCKMILVEKSIEFKSGEYGGQSTENQNSATAANWFGRRRPALNPPKCVYSIRLRPSGPRGPHAVSLALGGCQRWHVRRQKPLSAA
jgi:hypothetical protein